VRNARATFGHDYSGFADQSTCLCDLIHSKGSLVSVAPFIRILDESYLAMHCTGKTDENREKLLL